VEHEPVGDNQPVPKGAPLTTLLSWVWIAHTIEIDNSFEGATSERVGRHFHISLPMWTNGLRCIDDEGITVGELGRRARAKCNIGGLERWGWVSIGDPGGTRRDGYGSARGLEADTVLRPTRAGAFARRIWPHVVGGVEERWRNRFGGDAIDTLRDALLAVVTPMPWSPPEVAPPDGFLTHVVRVDDTDEDERPLVALLGQVLTSFTLDHEQKAELSLPLAANVLRAIGSGTVRIRDLPALTGLSKEAVAMAVTYLGRRCLATSGSERTIGLTPDGLDALENYFHRAARLESKQLRDALGAVVAQRETLCAGLVPPEGCWRAKKPYLMQTQRLLADPIGALPWHPMVLHRGGWPDGS
jgi:hypothetical protein